MELVFAGLRAATDARHGRSGRRIDTLTVSDLKLCPPCATRPPPSQLELLACVDNGLRGVQRGGAGFNECVICMARPSWSDGICARRRS